MKMLHICRLLYCNLYPQCQDAWAKDIDATLKCNRSHFQTDHKDVARLIRWSKALSEKAIIYWASFIMSRWRKLNNLPHSSRRKQNTLPCHVYSPSSVLNGVACCLISSMVAFTTPNPRPKTCMSASLSWWSKLYLWQTAKEIKSNQTEHQTFDENRVWRQWRPYFVRQVLQNVFVRHSQTRACFK